MSLFQRTKRKVRDRAGFTLVEMIVAIVIMLVLAAALVPNVYRYISQAAKASAKQDAASLLTQIQADLAWDISIDEASLTDDKTGALDAADIGGGVIASSSLYGLGLPQTGGLWTCQVDPANDYQLVSFVYIASSTNHIWTYTPERGWEYGDSSGEDTP